MKELHTAKYIYLTIKKLSFLNERTKEGKGKKREETDR